MACTAVRFRLIQISWVFNPVIGIFWNVYLIRTDEMKYILSEGKYYKIKVCTNNVTWINALVWPKLIFGAQSYKVIYARKLRLESRSISNFLDSTTLES